MTPFSEDLITKLRESTLKLPDARPRLLMGADEVQAVRERAWETPGVVDILAKRARAASVDQSFFGSTSEDLYLFSNFRGVIKALSDAALILEDEQFAKRALGAVEFYFRLPTRQWPPKARRAQRCHLVIGYVAADVGLAMDHCAPFWPTDAKRAVSQRVIDDLLPRFLETWRKQDEFWAKPSYNYNWKMNLGGCAGLGALACEQPFPEQKDVVEASLAAVLTVLDTIPPEGDWREGPGYYLGSLALGLRFAVALKRATGGTVDLMSHPSLKHAGDFVMHLTEPDGGLYNTGDNPIYWPGGTSYETWDYMSLLAKENRRGDWARVARMREHVTLERLMWDDQSLEGVTPPESDTALGFPWTGIATMRSGWDDQATYIGFKSGYAQVGHAQLDANSFVVTARGERLLIDEGTWPYASLSGYFEYDGPRWDFDNNGTIGHNSLLVDGGGQHPASRDFGAEYSGKLVAFSSGPQVDIAVGDATAAYAGKLDRYVRTLAYVKPDLLFIYDQVASSEPRYLEWLFHHDGAIDGDENVTTITRGDATLTLTRVLPEEADCWRTSDVSRTSLYMNSDTLEPARVGIRYRSFGPFHPCQEMEVLWAVFVGDPQDVPTVEAVAEDTILKVAVTLAGGDRRDVIIDRVS
jgi:hypothetical protein